MSFKWGYFYRYISKQFKTSINHLDKVASQYPGRYERGAPGVTTSNNKKLLDGLCPPPIWTDWGRGLFSADPSGLHAAHVDALSPSSCGRSA